MEAKIFEWRKRRTATECIADTFQVIRNHFGPLISAFLAISAPVMLFAAIYYQLYAATSFLSAAGNPFARVFEFYQLRKLIIGFIFLCAGHAMVPAVILNYLKLAVNGVRPGINDVWNGAKRSVLKCFFITILTFLIFIVLFLLLIFSIQVSPILFIVLILGFGAFSVYLLTRLSLVYCAAVFDDLSVAASFSRSWDYTRQNFWPSTGVWFLSYLIAYIMSFIVKIPEIVLTLTATFAGNLPEFSLSTLAIVLGITGRFINMFFTSIVSISLALNYLNLEEKTEGTGLMERINELNTNTETKNWGEEKY